MFEHFGTWGVSAERLLNTLSLKSKDKEGKNCSADFKTYWRHQFSVTLQKLNARVMMKKLNIVQGGSILDNKLRRVQVRPH